MKKSSAKKATLILGFALFYTSCVQREFNKNNAGLQGADGITEIKIEPTPCKYPLGDGFVENVNIVCGSLAVKENRSQPGSRAIRLHVMRLLSTSAESVPVVRLLGGPGASSGQVVSQPRSHFASLLAERELVVFDQRGSGWSEPNMECNEVSAQGIEGLRPCLARLMASGVDLSAYNVAESAEDVADLATALGKKQVLMWGISFGTRLGLEVMRRHPDRIQAAVLDSLVLPQIPFPAYSGAAIDGALSQLEVRCAAQPSCGKAFPGALVDDALRAVSESSLPLPGEGALGSKDLLKFLSQSLFVGGAYGQLPKFLDAVRRRDGLTAKNVKDSISANLWTWGSDPGVGKPNRPPRPDAMGYSMLCGDFKFTLNPERIAVAYANVRSTIAAAFRNDSEGERMICSEWPTANVPSIVEPVVSDIPTLLLGGEFDSATPAAWATEAAKKLKRSTVVLVAATGHGSSRSPCGSKLVQAFLSNPGGPLDTRCATQATIEFKVD